MAEIVIDGVRKAFGATVALENVNLRIADGEFLALLGPSGCGKTTLLRIIAGLEVQTAGRVLIGGHDVSDLPPRKRGLAMVFQNYAVFPHMTVADNVGFGLRMSGADKVRIARQVEKAAALLHIEPYLQRYPGQLSGGQRQRVAVARALAIEPAVLLMDEPLSNLDALLRLEMRAELKGVLQEAGTTTVYVTHDQTEAMGLADRIAVLHTGRIVQMDRPTEIYRNPATQFVGGFVGNPPMNFLSLPVSGGRVQFGAVSLAAPTNADTVVLGIRGEDLEMAEPSAGFPFEVRVTEPMGSHTLLTGSVVGQQIRVVAPPTRGRNKARFSTCGRCRAGSAGWTRPAGHCSERRRDVHAIGAGARRAAGEHRRTIRICRVIEARRWTPLPPQIRAMCLSLQACQRRRPQARHPLSNSPGTNHARSILAAEQPGRHPTGLTMVPGGTPASFRVRRHSAASNSRSGPVGPQTIRCRCSHALRAANCQGRSWVIGPSMRIPMKTASDSD